MIMNEDASIDKKFQELSTSQLIEAYELAKQLNLSVEFQKLLAIALNLRLTEQL